MWRYLLMSVVTVTLHISTESPHGPAITTCTGVYVSPYEVLTASHCMEHYRGHMWVKTSANKSFSADLEVMDIKKDIALIKIKGPAHIFVPIGPAPSKLDNVFTVNSGEDYKNTFAQGYVSNFILDEFSNTPMIMHTAPILQGASGSGLFDSNGRLVGINTQLFRGFTFAVDIRSIDTFLKDMRLQELIASN